MLILTNISMPNTLLFCKVSSSAISVLSLNETNVTILFSLLLKSERRILHNVGNFRSREQPYISRIFRASSGPFTAISISAITEP